MPIKKQNEAITTKKTKTQKNSGEKPSNQSNLNQAVKKQKAMTTKPSTKTETSITSGAKSSPPKNTVEAAVLPYDEKPGEDYMNTKQREHFRHILKHWKYQLLEEVERTVHHMQDEAANFPDPNDRATQEEEFSLELRTRDRERQLVKKIDEALQKIDTGDYGYCDACGIEIGIRRLEARPTATLCIDCKTIDEIKERQRGNGAG